MLAGHAGIVWDAAISPDGRFLAAASGYGTARIFLLPVEDLLALARARVTRDFTEAECR